jgi:hypothetical protein
LARAKFDAVRPLTAWEKTICQVTLALFLGLPLARFKETMVVSGRSTGVTVALAAPAMSGSSVERVVKLLPLTVPWLVTVVAGTEGSLMVTV